MVQRKPHQKSRNGCIQCKKRRVKCNEDRPCWNCVRRNETCSLDETSNSTREGSFSYGFFEPRPQDDNGVPNAESPACQDIPQSVSSTEKLPKATRLKELYLMHHYGAVTCETMAFMPHQIDVWKKILPREATRHPFLMEGLLSLTALHCAHLEPLESWDYTEIAIHHQISGISGYRAALNCISEENYEAVFAFSIILTVLGFAIPTASSVSKRQPMRPSDIIVSIFELLKGVEITTCEYTEPIRVGKLKGLFRNVDHWSSHRVAVPWKHADTAMTRLRERAAVVTKYVGTEARDVYISAIEDLTKSFREVEHAGAFQYVVAWPILGGKNLVTLLKKGDPMALLLWAHYGVLTLAVHDLWWGKGFGVCIIEGLCGTLHCLDPEWDNWTEWARHCASLVS